MVTQRTDDSPFDIRDQRVMVSLGPLSPKKYCSYSCPFCYVHAGFARYVPMDVTKIVEWIGAVDRRLYDIIYVSGDTDSFARPRTEAGIDLLQQLVQFDVDILFTTRAVFSAPDLSRLECICLEQKRRKHFLFGCVSVAQLRTPHLEPKPITSPKTRIEQLRHFAEDGLVSVLAMRPFLPIVPVAEYLEIIDLCRAFVDVVLGEAWFADETGILERGVFRGPTPTNITFVRKKMDFDTNDDDWKVFEATEIEAKVRERCQQYGIPFFMRSRPAIEWIRSHRGE